MERRLMLVGSVDCGKTSLAQRINDLPLAECKTQTATVFDDGIIDTPGEYLEMRSLYRALTVTAVEANVIGLVHAADDRRSFFAPQFASMFGKPVVGILTKTDLADRTDIERGREILRLAGAEQIFEVSSYRDTGIRELIDAVDRIIKEQCSRSGAYLEPGGIC